MYEKKLVCVKATSTKPFKRILFLSFFLLVFSFPFCAFHLCFFAFPIPFEMYTRILNKISIIIIIVQMMTKKIHAAVIAQDHVLLCCAVNLHKWHFSSDVQRTYQQTHRELSKPYFWLDAKHTILHSFYLHFFV